MTWGKKSGGRDFVKGEVIPGPGRPRLSDEAKEYRKLTLDDYIKLVTKTINMDVDQLNEVLKDKKATVLEKYVAKIAQLGGHGGDVNRLGFLLDRLIGPVKQKVDHTSSDGSMQPKGVDIKVDLSKLSLEELEMLERIQKKIQNKE